jgi:hypothetical protein
MLRSLEASPPVSIARMWCWNDRFHDDAGTVAPGEVASLWKVCNTNEEAVTYIKDFYKL